MLSRIFTAIAAIIITGLAISVPIMLTEAGESTTGQGKALDAQFTYVNAVTGESAFVFVSAVTETVETQSSGPGGAQSSRPNNGKSDRPGTTPSTETFTTLDVFIDFFDAQGAYVAFASGSTTPRSLTVAGDLSSGSVLEDLELEVFSTTTGELIDEVEVDVDLAFAATGPLVTGRDSSTETIKSPRQRFTFRGTNSHREAEATGAVSVDGVNFAANGSDFARIGTFQFKSTVRP